MFDDVYIITWPVESKDDWLPCPEDHLVPEMNELFGEFIYTKKYLSLNLNLILLSENHNCGLFLDTKTGDWVGLGCFRERDLRKSPMFKNKRVGYDSRKS